jgi:hypothetical protein
VNKTNTNFYLQKKKKNFIFENIELFSEHLSNKRSLGCWFLGTDGKALTNATIFKKIIAILFFFCRKILLKKFRVKIMRMIFNQFDYLKMPYYFFCTESETKLHIIHILKSIV